jgi:hypothetical protein
MIPSFPKELPKLEELVPMFDDPVELQNPFEAMVVSRYNRGSQHTEQSSSSSQWRPKVKQSSSFEREPSRLEELIRAHENLALNQPRTSTFEEIFKSTNSNPFAQQRANITMQQQNLKQLQSRLEEIVPTENHHLFVKPRDPPLKSSSTSKAPILEELILSLDNQLFDSVSSTPMHSPLHPASDSSDMEVDANNLLESSSEEFVEPDFQLDSIVQTYLMTIGQNGANSFSSAIKDGPFEVHSRIHGLVKHFAKFASLQRYVYCLDYMLYVPGPDQNFKI